MNEKNLTGRVCPTCGANEGEKEFEDFFCVDCQQKRRKTQLPYEIPKEIVILQCKKCGIYKIKRWCSTLSDAGIDIPSLFRGNISDAKVVSLSERKVVVEFILVGEKTNRELPVRVHRTLCNNCTKIARGYFESIVQIRGDPAWVARMRKKIEREILLGSFITKEEEFKYGVDLYMGSTRAVKKVFRFFGFKPKKSERLHTEKNGRKLYRMTFLLRQPEEENIEEKSKDNFEE